MINKSKFALVLGAQMPQFLYGNARPAFLSSTGNRVRTRGSLCIPSLQFVGFLLVVRRVSEVDFLPKNVDYEEEMRSVYR